MLTVTGIVVKGQQRGRGLGYPTANLQVTSGDLPKPGIHAAWAVVDGAYFPAAASLGFNPTFGQGGGLSLEAHILDFSGDLYGREMTLQFVEYLRPEMAFSSVDELEAQMAQDCSRAAQILAEDAKKREPAA